MSKFSFPPQFFLSTLWFWIYLAIIIVIVLLSISLSEVAMVRYRHEFYRKLGMFFEINPVDMDGDMIS